MATDLERLIVTLEARTKEFEREMARARNVTVAQLRRIERDTQAHAARQQATFARLGAGIQQTIQRSLIAPLGALAGGAGARAVIGFADTFTAMENSLKVAGLEGEALGATLERLFEIADKHAAPVESLTTLYGRLALSQKELNISSAEMIGFTDNVAAALRVSGKSATESSGALLQLSQALGGGIVRAEEFNSILEGAQPIAQAVANGLEEAGGSIAKLRQLVIDGRVSSEAFFRAFMVGGADLQQQASEAEKTVGQALTSVRNAFIKAVGSVDNLTGASEALGTALGVVATQVRLLAEDFAKLKGAADAVIGFFDDLDAGLRKFGQDIGLADSVATEMEKAKAELASLEKFLADALARGDEKAAAEFQNEFGRRVIELINQINPGPAFERHGRDSAIAFKKGFEQGPKPTVTLTPAPTGGASTDPVITGGLATRSSTVPGAGGPVAVIVTRPISVEPAGVAAGVGGLDDTLDQGFGDANRIGSSIAGHAGRTADRIPAIAVSVDGAGGIIVSAIALQTASLRESLQTTIQSVAERTSGLKTSFSPETGTVTNSAGSGTIVGVSFGMVADRAVKGFARGIQERQDAIQSEQAVLQAGLQFKQLSPEQTAAAELRLAELSLESAKLQSSLSEMTSALSQASDFIMNSFVDPSYLLVGSRAGYQAGLTGQPFDFTSTGDLIRRGGFPAFAGGGAVHGPGGPRSDSVPIMASAGEYVVNAAATKKHRALLEAINQGSMRMLADGGLVARVSASAQRLAAGGVVRASASSTGRGDITIHLGGLAISTPDAGSFRGSERAIAHRVAGEVAQALRQRGLI